MANKAYVPGMIITMTNPMTQDKINEMDVKGKVWNSGLSSVQESHVDEMNFNGWVLHEDEDAVEGFYAKNYVAAVRLYKNNEYVHLNPGDTVKLTVSSAEAAAYYDSIPDSDILKVTVEGATPADPAVE